MPEQLPVETATPRDFKRGLVEMLPHLRNFARSLTRNPAEYKISSMARSRRPSGQSAGGDCSN